MKRILPLLALLCHIFAYTQELPPILRFTPGTYSAGNQNWMIGQGNDRFLYFANNEGLLEYNGSEWKLYPSPNETIIRSVKVVGNRIYTGCYMEFGYWTHQNDGTLHYHSLSAKVRKRVLDDEQFWNIAQYDRWIIFQSLNQIFIYDTTTSKFNIIAPETGVNRVFIAGNAIYYQTFGSGLYEIENGRSRLVSADKQLIDHKLVNIYALPDRLLLQTHYNGFLQLAGGAVTRWATEADNELQSTNIYSSQRLSDGGFALGTVSNGIYILSPQGRVRYHITQNKGLSNNTALSLFEDRDQNLWVGLDNGINCINLKSAVHSFVDDTGFLGTVYASILYDGNLYIGTNQGLFYKPYQSSQPFTFVPGTKGQVWSLYSYGGTLFCGHDLGTFIVNGGFASHIFPASGTWKFSRHPYNSNLLLQGNYHGISVLEKTATGWKFRNWIKGFDYSSRYFEVSGNNDIYISHEYKGVFRITTDNDYQKANSFTAYKTPAKGKNSSLCTFNGSIYYATKDGFFRLNPSTKQFRRDALMSNAIEADKYTSGKMIPDPTAGRLWFFSLNYINYFSNGKLDTGIKHHTIAIPSSLTNSMQGYENITLLDPGRYLIGTTDGFYTIAPEGLKFERYNLVITGMEVNEQNRQPAVAALTGTPEFGHRTNNITFNFTVPEYTKYLNAEYRYKLEGYQDDWSGWSDRPSVNFKNLPAGSYTFKVMARTGDKLSLNTPEVSFTILKPWYATTLAIIIYGIIGCIVAFLINRAYTRYYDRQRLKLIEENNRLLEIKELENEQELMRIKNDQLQQDFESKNRELAVSTMNLIRKNELLSAIKEDLKKQAGESEKSVKSVITTINKNINEDDTWDIFKEAFNNADKDFLKKMKTAHPALTPNDLRLCAYLRLNLSSKEIAPLLNISVRSVEIKRYRLRKKMDLPHELGLVEYILGV